MLSYHLSLLLSWTVQDIWQASRTLNILSVSVSGAITQPGNIIILVLQGKDSFTSSWVEFLNDPEQDGGQKDGSKQQTDSAEQATSIGVNSRG